MSQANQIWSTDQSPVRIEYSAELLRQVWREGSGDRRGVLYGRRRDAKVHLLAARRTGHSPDLLLIELERVGVFVVRSGGDVFLTEQDLEFAEWNGAALVLVLAADRGGFFLRDSDGSMLAIRSHREFVFRDSAGPKGVRSSLKAGLNVAALAVCLALSVAAALYGEPKAALTLDAHEEARQVIAQWSPGVRGTLEIRDGDRTLQLPVTVHETTATYQPESPDVDIVLTTLDGVSREGHVHVMDAPRRKPSAVPPLLDQVTRLELERDGLLARAGEYRSRVEQLEKMLKTGP